MTYDAIIVGGSFAGISAALQLARARRSVLIVDEGVRRNRFAETSHGLMGHDGRPPGDIIADAKRQLMKYPTVDWLDAKAERAAAATTGFAIHTERSSHKARRLILATGITDTLPDLPGLEQHWGSHVFHCPYCHGYELEQGRIGVLASGPAAFHHAMLVSDWGVTTLFLNGAFDPDPDQQKALAKRSIQIERVPVTKLEADDLGNASVTLEDGRREELKGLFVQTTAKDLNPLAKALGCAFEEGPGGPYLTTDKDKLTSVKGCYAAGDVAREAGNLSVAVADGMTAGVAAHQSLIFEE